MEKQSTTNTTGCKKNKPLSYISRLLFANQVRLQAQLLNLFMCCGVHDDIIAITIFSIYLLSPYSAINRLTVAFVQTSPISFHPRKRDVCETASLIVFQYPAVWVLNFA